MYKKYEYRMLKQPPDKIIAGIIVILNVMGGMVGNCVPLTTVILSLSESTKWG